MIKKITLCFLLFLKIPLYGLGSWGSIGHKIASSAKGVGKFAKQVGQGLAQMVGHVPAGYVFSFIVYNGVQENTEVLVRTYRNVMGARFKGDIHHSLTIAPGQTSGLEFSNIKLYFGIDIPNCDYIENHYTLGEQNDKTIYVYHTYNDPVTFKNYPVIFKGDPVTV